MPLPMVAPSVARANSLPPASARIQRIRAPTCANPACARRASSLTRCPRLG